MLSFLIRVGKMGSVEQVIRSDPPGLIPDAHATLPELFQKDAKSALLHLMKRSTQRQEALWCDSPLTLRSQPARMLACMTSLNNGFLLFAAEENPALDSNYDQGYRAVVTMFMNIIKGYADKAVAGRGAPAAEQTEMIQTLMGELRLRKRLLEEANDRLSTMNQDLNNRLVKDSLTGLVSRYQYRAEMEYLIGGNPGKPGVFVFIDIDDFKLVNDKFGHAAGDQYLVEFAARLKKLPFRDAVAMRISGDEFGLFVYGPEESGEQAMEGIWKEIQLHVLSSPIRVNGRNLPVSLSAGMAVYGRDTQEIYELIELADHAMYAAKRRGKNRYCVYAKTRHDG